MRLARGVFRLVYQEHTLLARIKTKILKTIITILNDLLREIFFIPSPISSCSLLYKLPQLLQPKMMSHLSLHG